MTCGVILIIVAITFGTLGVFILSLDDPNKNNWDIGFVYGVAMLLVCATCCITAGGKVYERSIQRQAESLGYGHKVIIDGKLKWEWIQKEEG